MCRESPSAPGHVQFDDRRAGHRSAGGHSRMRASTGRKHHFRRTGRMALAIAAVGGVMVAGADLGAAAPAAEEEFNPGIGNATAAGYTVNPVFGNLSFGM